MGINIIVFVVWPILFFVSYLKRINKKVRKAEYYRDIPCDKDLFKAYYIALTYELINNKTDLLGAMFLKWLKEKKISIIERNTGSNDNEDICIKFNLNDSEIAETETKLLKYMVQASQDGILEKKELEKWCQENYNTILNWFDRIINNEENKLIENGDIEVIEKGRVFKRKKYIYNSNILNEAIKLSGLKKYLKDYTLIRDREPIEVELFEDYLIYAQMFGMAKEVMKEFKDLYPNILAQSSFKSFDNISLLMICANRGISDAKTAKSIAESKASSYYSGVRRLFIGWWRLFIRRRPEVAHQEVEAGMGSR